MEIILICYTYITLQNVKKYSLLCLLFLAVFSTALYLSLAWFIAIEAEKNTAKNSDVIVVLGARSYINGSYNPCLKARVDKASELYHKKLASKLLVTGGNDKEDHKNEAETMREIAIENGVNPEDILMEKSASSTYENFLFSKKILRERGLTSVIIVTEPFHMARAMLVANKLNFTHTAAPADRSSCWKPNKYFSKYFLKEPIAIIGYKLQSKL